MALEEREHAAPRVGRRVTGLDERRMERGDVALSHPGGAAEVVDGDRCDALLAQSQGERLVEVVRLRTRRETMALRRRCVRRPSWRRNTVGPWLRPTTSEGAIGGDAGRADGAAYVEPAAR